MHKPRNLSLLILAEIDMIGSITLERAQVLSSAIENRTDRASDVLMNMRVNRWIKRNAAGEYVRVKRLAA